MKEKILVIGSANMDMVVKTQEFPKMGETLLGGEFYKFPGGKGANQAVAAARLGGDVTFICKLGKDEFGDSLVEKYKREGINTDNILVDPECATGVALISVNKDGENKIVVAPGANGKINTTDIEAYEKIIASVDIIILQLEIPLNVVGDIIKIAKKNNVRVILNPAPAQTLPDSYFNDLFLISPNQIEAAKLTGIPIKGRESTIKAAEKLHDLGVQNVIITLGDKGAFLSTDEYVGHISSFKIKTVDTTAAGDVFNGALAVALTNNHSWEEAATFACRAAAMSVSKNGAQNSAPTKSELQSFSLK